ncbi:MAG: 4Fe-4S dicluster domain-containing protein [Ignavibacteriales bacterium]|nr:4Fe-4S dicluster domain-containing protein [Ignavibacteriales bacterium]
MNTYGILIDTTLCVGCYECENSCASRWGFPQNDAHKLSSEKNTAVQNFGEIFVPRLCMHCQDPTCVSVCPVGAFTKTELGPVVYDAEKCIGCRYCMQACPFDVPRYQWNSVNPKVTKCDMCYERITRGEKPACVEACLPEARIFGKLEDLLTEAKKRISENPETYHSTIYGMNEVGGASILYLASKPFEQLEMRTNLPQYPLPDLTWAVLSKIPNYIFWGGTLLGGIWWLTNRRREVEAMERTLKQNGTNHENSKKEN